MKTKLIKKAPNLAFKPFKIEIEVETIQEARLLFHVFNSTNLYAQLKEGGYRVISREPHSEDIAKDIPGSLWGEIEDEIKLQGFKL